MKPTAVLLPSEELRGDLSWFPGIHKFPSSQRTVMVERAGFARFVHRRCSAPATFPTTASKITVIVASAAVCLAQQKAKRL